MEMYGFSLGFHGAVVGLLLCVKDCSGASIVIFT